MTRFAMDHPIITKIIIAAIFAVILGGAILFYRQTSQGNEPGDLGLAKESTSTTTEATTTTSRKVPAITTTKPKETTTTVSEPDIMLEQPTVQVTLPAETTTTSTKTITPAETTATTAPITTIAPTQGTEATKYDNGQRYVYLPDFGIWVLGGEYAEGAGGGETGIDQGGDWTKIVGNMG